MTCAGCLLVYMGIHDKTLTIAEEPERKQLVVKRVIIHDGFKMKNLENDIALIEIEPMDIERSAYIKNICLPGGEVPQENEKCFIAGWGSTEDGNNDSKEQLF